jgi:hypothetical protein
MPQSPVAKTGSSTNNVIIPPKIDSAQNFRELKYLTDNFRPLVEKVIKNCAKRGVKLVPYSTLRGPMYQARQYVKGRSKILLNSVIENLKLLKCENIYKPLEAAQLELPKNNKFSIVTHSLPGESWHQYGEAVDMYVDKNGKDDWNNTAAYRIYQEEAEKLGLTSGGSFKRLKEPVHCQLSPASKPNVAFHVINRWLGEKFI